MLTHFILQDLNEDDVMVLDSGDEVYVWVGRGSDDQEKEKALAMAEVCGSVQGLSGLRGCLSKVVVECLWCTHKKGNTEKLLKNCFMFV